MKITAGENGGEPEGPLESFHEVLKRLPTSLLKAACLFSSNKPLQEKLELELPCSKITQTTKLPGRVGGSRLPYLEVDCL